MQVRSATEHEWRDAFLGSIEESKAATSHGVLLQIISLRPGVGQVFRVRCGNAVGACAWSADSAILCTETCAPGPPSNVTLISRTHNSLTFSWTATDEDGGLTVVGVDVDHRLLCPENELAQVKGGEGKWYHRHIGAQEEPKITLGNLDPGSKYEVDCHENACCMVS